MHPGINWVHINVNYLWKVSLNSDGHKFQQYQQNEHPPLISINLMTFDVGNPDPGLGQTQTCDRVKQVNGIPTLIMGSPTEIHI